MKEIGEGAWAAAAVKKAIEDVQTAVMVAVVRAWVPEASAVPPATDVVPASAV